jgi:hypothetical protein
MEVNAGDVIKTVPKLMTVLPKLQMSNDNKRPPSGADKLRTNAVDLEKIYKRMKSVSENNENIIKLFPDIELCVQILVGNILSPKNMTGTYLIYKLEAQMASATATAEILDHIKNHISKHYKLEEKLPEWIREAMFEKGAYVTAIIPESSVDTVINGDLEGGYVSTESYKNAFTEMASPLGLLSEDSHDATLSASLEGYSDVIKTNMSDIVKGQNFSIVDNYDVLKLPKVRASMRRRAVMDIVRRKKPDVSMEKLEYTDIFRSSTARLQDGNVKVVKTKEESTRTSLGAPMVVKLNSEAVIPIFTPGDPTKHLGYIVLLDGNTGYPLNDFTKTNLEASSNNVYSGSYSGANNQASLTQKAIKNMIGESSDVGINTIYEIYKDVVEKQILNKVKRGIYGYDVELSDKNDIYFTMFSRALANQKTSMLFLPAELVTYLTYDYNKNGTGRSILENLSVLMSMRAIMLMAKIVAFAKKAIDVTNVNITFDPNDPDPEKTMEEVMDSVMKLRENSFPLGINNPSDLVDWAQRAGLKFSYENHPGMPAVKVDFEAANLDHEIPSDDLEDVIRKQGIMAMGLSPEQVDNAFSPEFAVTVTSNNLLMAKRTIINQVKTEVALNKFCHDIIINDEELRAVIKQSLAAHIADIDKHLTPTEKTLYNDSLDDFYEHLIDKLANGLRVSLPRPESISTDNMSAEYDKHKENLEKVLDSIISTDILPQDLAGDMSDHVDTVKNVFKHYLLRTWMSENNFFPEAFDLIKQTAEGEDKLDLNKVMAEHIRAIMLSSGDLFKSIKEARNAIEADVARAGIGDLTGGESSSSADSSSSDGDTGGGDGDFGMGGGDDFGVGADLGGDGTAAEEGTGDNEDVKADE